MANKHTNKILEERAYTPHPLQRSMPMIYLPSIRPYILEVQQYPTVPSSFEDLAFNIWVLGEDLWSKYHSWQQSVAKSVVKFGPWDNGVNTWLLDWSHSFSPVMIKLSRETCFKIMKVSCFPCSLFCSFLLPLVVFACSNYYCVILNKWQLKIKMFLFYFIYIDIAIIERDFSL